MSTHEKPSPSLADIAKTKDPATRARVAAAHRASLLSQAKEALDIRDAALVEMKDAKVSIPQIAEQTGVNIATVKAVLR